MRYYFFFFPTGLRTFLGPFGDGLRFSCSAFTAASWAKSSSWCWRCSSISRWRKASRGSLNATRAASNDSCNTTTVWLTASYFWTVSLANSAFQTTRNAWASLACSQRGIAVTPSSISTVFAKFDLDSLLWLWWNNLLHLNTDVFWLYWKTDAYFDTSSTKVSVISTGGEKVSPILLPLLFL